MPQNFKLKFMLFFMTLMVSVTSIEARKCHKFLAPKFKEGKLYTVDVKDLIPGQTHIGQFLVVGDYGQKRFKHMETKKKAILLKKTPVIRLVSKDFDYLIMQDNHHSLTRFLNTYEDSGRKLKVQIRVVKTIRSNQSESAIIQDFIDRGWLWSLEEVRRSWTFTKNWPQSPKQLRDWPLRSLVQLMFDELDLSGRSFVPYIQFILARQMQDAGFSFKEFKLYKNSKREDLVKEALAFVFTNKDLKSVLYSNIIKKDKKRALEKLQGYENSLD